MERVSGPVRERLIRSSRYRDRSSRIVERDLGARDRFRPRYWRVFGIHLVHHRGPFCRLRPGAALNAGRHVGISATLRAARGQDCAAAATGSLRGEDLLGLIPLHLAGAARGSRGGRTG